VLFGIAELSDSCVFFAFVVRFFAVGRTRLRRLVLLVASCAGRIVPMALVL